MTDEAGLLAIRIARMKELMARLDHVAAADDRKRLRDQLTGELNAAQAALKTIIPKKP